MTDTSTVPVVIGLDVLEAITKMVKPQGLSISDRIYLCMAEEAVIDAYINPQPHPQPQSDYIAQLTDCSEDPLRCLEPRG